MTSLPRAGGDASAKGTRNGDQNRLVDVRHENQRCCAVEIDQHGVFVQTDVSKRGFDQLRRHWRNHRRTSPSPDGVICPLVLTEPNPNLIAARIHDERVLVVRTGGQDESREGEDDRAGRRTGPSHADYRRWPRQTFEVHPRTLGHDSLGVAGFLGSLATE